MRRFSLISATLCLVLSGLNAQNEVDALRYSRQMPVGTARAVGLGGAVGALGGDFTSLSVNPAGLGLYRGSEITFSPSIFVDNTTSSFLNNSYEESNHNFNIGNFGFVGNYKTNQEKGWISTSFAFGYNRTANFNRNILMSGVNNNSSLLDNFTDWANAFPDDLNSYYEQLAYDVWLIDTIAQKYYNHINKDGYGQLQRRSFSSRGSAGEYTFSFGTNFNHRLYLGATFGVARVRYEQDVIHTEEDNLKTIGFFDKFIFRENLRTTGNGYTLKLGAIARPIDFLRIGLAYHLPTFYNLNDRFTTEMESFIDPGQGFPKYEAYSPILDSDYKLQTPSKFIGSIAATIGKVGLVSIDYERIDYSKAKLNAQDHDFFNENSVIKGLYRQTNNLRFGGEMRFGTTYFRGGYSFYQSPYVSNEINSDANINTYSAGIGMRGSLFFVDFGFSNSNVEEVYYMYVPQMTDGSRNKSIGNNMIMTIGYRF